jgi:hypothetical protein
MYFVLSLRPPTAAARTTNNYLWGFRSDRGESPTLVNEGMSLYKNLKRFDKRSKMVEYWSK